MYKFSSLLLALSFTACIDKSNPSVGHLISDVQSAPTRQPCQPLDFAGCEQYEVDRLCNGFQSELSQPIDMKYDGIANSITAMTIGACLGHGSALVTLTYHVRKDIQEQRAVSEMTKMEQDRVRQQTRIAGLLDYSTLPGGLSTTTRKLVRYAIPTKGEIAAISFIPAPGYGANPHLPEVPIYCCGDQTAPKIRIEGRTLVIEGYLKYRISNLCEVAREEVLYLCQEGYMAYDTRWGTLYLE